MSTLKVNKLRDTSGSTDAITLDPNGGAVLAGVTTISTARVTTGITSTSLQVGAAVTITESGIEASGIGITVANINGSYVGGRRNMVINGGMAIDQRTKGTATTPAHTDYVVDRWENHLSQSSKFSVQRVEDAPNGEGVGKYSSKITSLSAYTIQSGDFFVYNHNIEGTNIDHLQFGTSSAKTITVSFYVKSSLTGTFSLAVRNSAYNRSQVQEYSISSANTWEKKSLTFAGDTSGTWLTTTGVGLRLSWGLGGGSTYHIASTGTWLGVDDWTTSNSTSVVSTNAATWYITGVQMEIGTQATSFEHRSVGEELALCQRYFYRHGDLSGTRNYALMGVGMIGHNGSTDTGKIQISSPVRMRTQPTATAIPSGAEFIISTGNGGEGTSDMYCNSAPALWTGASGDINFWVDFQRTSGGNPDQGIACMVYANNNGANMGFDAEL